MEWMESLPPLTRATNFMMGRLMGWLHSAVRAHPHLYVRSMEGNVTPRLHGYLCLVLPGFVLCYQHPNKSTILNVIECPNRRQCLKIDGQRSFHTTATPPHRIVPLIPIAHPTREWHRHPFTRRNTIIDNHAPRSIWRGCCKRHRRRKWFKNVKSSPQL